MPPEFHGMARTASIDAHHHIGAGKIATINQNFAAAQLRSAALDVTNEVADTVDWSMSTSWNVRNLGRSAFLASADEALSDVTLQTGATLQVEDPSSLTSAPADTPAVFETVP